MHVFYLPSLWAHNSHICRIFAVLRVGIWSRYVRGGGGALRLACPLRGERKQTWSSGFPTESISISSPRLTCNCMNLTARSAVVAPVCLQRQVMSLRITKAVQICIEKALVTSSNRHVVNSTVHDWRSSSIWSFVESQCRIQSRNSTFRPS